MATETEETDSAQRVVELLTRSADRATASGISIAVATLKGSDRDVERVRERSRRPGGPDRGAYLSAAGLARAIFETAQENGTRLKARYAEEVIREHGLDESMLNPSCSADVTRHAEGWRERLRW